MGCCGGEREKDTSIKNDVKWEYVNLNDFKSSSCLTPLAYVYLWIMLFVSVSVYAVDTFTAINLLAFNKWAGQIKPAVDLKYSRWIFAGCIILSFVLLLYRWLRALKVMRGSKVAKSYLDPLAVRVESIRMGKEGRGWKRFLVFAELTKSRKGADYVALFAYYSFEACLRIIFAEGPRVVINGMTLYAYAEANFLPTGEHAASSGQSPFVQFWKNFVVLAETDQLQMAIIIGMLWTCLIWIFSAISLAVSVILYLIFLWHHIPSDAGGLSGYCRTKVNRRMERIVKTKTAKALKKENEIRARQEAQAYRTGNGDFKRQPTLPDVAALNGSTPSLPMLSRQTTMTTLPEYSSRPGTAQPAEASLPPMPVATPIDTNPRSSTRRHMTNASDTSWSSYNSNAPLISSAGDIGYAPAERMQTPASGASSPWSTKAGAHRNITDFPQHSERSYTPGPPRPSTAQSMRGPSDSYQMESIPRPGTGMSHWSRPMRQPSGADTLPAAPGRGMTPALAYPLSASSTSAPTLPDQRVRTPAPYNPYFPPVSPIPESGGRESPTFTAGGPTRSHTPVGPPSRTMTPGHALPLPRLRTTTPVQNASHGAQPLSNNGNYVAFNPNVLRAESPASYSATVEPYRSYTQPRWEVSHSPMVSNETYLNLTHSNNQPTETPSHFSRPYPAQSGRQVSQDAANLRTPRTNPPRRGNSFDDILDHY